LPAGLRARHELPSARPIRCAVDYRAVAIDGAARAASMLASLF
jgi:hypothetical protein